MAATSIFFNGRLISIPGSYSEVDVSGLEQVGLGATGIVAMLGEAEGGRPAGTITKVDDIIRLNNPSQVRAEYRSGDLREAGGMLFEPSSDDNILAGAVQVVGMKVNPATQAAAIFANAQGDAMTVTSRDYGAFTSQINVSIVDGTSKGKLLSIIFEDITESVDDLGGDAMFTLTYTKPTNGWDAMTAELQAGGNLECAGTRANTGLDGDVTGLLANGAVRVVSANAGDTTQAVTIYGLDGTGAVKSETLTLNGTTPVDGTQIFGAGDVLGAKVVGTTLGAVTVSDQVIPTTIMIIPLGLNQVQGLVLGVTMFVNNSIVTLVADAASTADVIVVGTNAAGAVQLEKITLNGTTAVPGVGLFSAITAIVLGDVAAARTVTSSAVAAKSLAAVQNTLLKAADFFNAKQSGITPDGFVFAIVTGTTGFLMIDMDVMVAPVSILGPANPNFLADLFTIVAWINQNSNLASAAVATGASGGAPDNTTAPVFLAGGVEGTTLFANWQAALDLLKQIRVNTIVALTGDPAVHAAVDAHCALMGGVGRSERDAKLGALNAGLTDVPTKTEYKQQIVDLNSRHIQLCGQAVERFNSAGDRAEFLPPFEGCVAAGMQAGSPVGTALTFKFANALSFRQHSSWNPTDDAEEMIQAGALILENVDGVGRRWVRGVTTHLSSSNLAFTEASVNEASNFAAFTFRTNLEIVVGKPGFSGTINAAKGFSITTLGLLVDETILVAWQSLTFDLSVDVLTVAVQIAPVIPINFVKTTLHLITIRQTA